MGNYFELETETMQNRLSAERGKYKAQTVGLWLVTGVFAVYAVGVTIYISELLTHMSGGEFLILTVLYGLVTAAGVLYTMNRLEKREVRRAMKERR